VPLITRADPVWVVGRVISIRPNVPGVNADIIGKNALVFRHGSSLNFCKT